MQYNHWFDVEENKTLMAICTRKLIRNIGIGAVIWGVINITIGIFAIQVTMINAGILILGVLMLGSGIRALTNPTLEILRIETGVALLLFLWNLGIAIYSSSTGGVFNIQGLIFPLVISGSFAKQYGRLAHLREHIDLMNSEKIKMTHNTCKIILKKKLKNEPRIVQTSNQRCRVQLMDEQAFFVQRDFMRSFVCLKEAVHEAVDNPDAKSLKMAFKHPLGTLKYQFNRKNSDKLKNWLSAQDASVTA